MKKILSAVLSVALSLGALAGFSSCSTAKPCTVSFYDDGIITSEYSSTTGSTVNFPADPVNYEDEQYTYTFSGWVDADGNAWTDSRTLGGDTVIYADYQKEAKIKFDEEPTFTFAMISDIHQQTNDRSSEMNFKAAMDQLSAEADLDAVVISGDLCDMAWTETTAKFEDGSSVYYSSTGEKKAQVRHLGDVFEKYVPQGTDILFCLGNHDQGNFLIDQKSLPYTVAYNKILTEYYTSKYGEQAENRYYNNDVKTSYSDSIADYDGMLTNGVRYAKMGTNHFILLDAYKFWRPDAAYSVTQLDWISDTLAYIDETYPDEPIFVIAHDPVLGSVYGSIDTWGNNCLNDILSQYNQVTMFTGHIHEANYHETAISQDKGFTVVEASSVKYTSRTTLASTDYGHNFDLTTSPTNQNCSSQGLLVRVYEDTTVRVTRFDFASGTISGADWVLDPVTSATRNTKYALESRKAANEAPYFRPETKINAVLDASQRYLNVSFSKARDKDSKVFGYKVEAKKSGADSAVKYVEGEMAVKDKITNISVAFDAAYLIEEVVITPIDIYGKEGASISITADKFVSVENVKAKSVKSFDNKKAQLGTTSANGTNYYAQKEFFYNDDGNLTNYYSTRTKGNIYVDAFGKEYTFATTITNARTCRAQTAKISNNQIGPSEAFKLGVNLATFEDNDRIYSICAYLDFNYWVEQEPAGGWDDTVLRRMNTGYVSYVMMVTGKGAVHYTTSWTIANSHAFTDADALYTKIRSDEGVTVKVERKGAEFNLYLDDQLFDTRSFEATFFKNGYMCTFNADTVSTFGISTLGAEGIFKNVSYTVK